MILSRLSPGTRFRIGTFEGRLVCVTQSAATVEIACEPREFSVYDKTTGETRVVRIGRSTKRTRISPTAEAEVLT